MLKIRISSGVKTALIILNEIFALLCHVLSQEKVMLFSWSSSEILWSFTEVEHCGF